MIVAASEGLTRPSAVKVVSRLSISAAWVSATGSSAPEKLLRPRMNPARSVREEARLAATGCRSASSGPKAPIARLRS